MTSPINLRAGWIHVIINPQKRFDSPDSFQEEIDLEELLSCWNNLKHIVDGVVNEQINRSKMVLEKNAKTRSVIDIYNILHRKNTVDETSLLKEVLKTGNFSKEEANSLIKKVKEEKVESGMAWY